MIAHVSIPALDPRSVALFFAKLIDGEALAFPVVEGAWIAIASDGSGTAIEVYPAGMAHHPGQGDPNAAAGGNALPADDQIYPDGDQLKPSAFHFALTSHLSEDEVLAAARAEGLRAIPCDRAGVFKLVEIWIEGVHLVEVVCGHERERYAKFMNPTSAATMFGPGLQPA